MIGVVGVAVAGAGALLGAILGRRRAPRLVPIPARVDTRKDRTLR